MVDSETNYTDQSERKLLDLDKLIKEQGEFKKLVVGCLADNMCLPFADSIFEAYVSNLSLMIAPHPEKQIKEAYRVLKPGSAACFSIWGREENTKQFTIPNQALTNLGREVPAGHNASYFAFSKDRVALRALFNQAGFS